MPGTTITGAIHRTPDDYHVIGPEDFGAPGLWARESVGPFTDIQAVGTLVTVHDSRFDPGRGIGHHPHRGMERLFYILEGGVDHDDSFNDIQGHMDTGDLGILTEGRRGMVHSEWNHEDDATTRAYILVYPTDPTPPTATFDAIRDPEADRTRPADGVTIKVVVEGSDERLHGDLRRFLDIGMDAGSTLTLTFEPEEAALLFLVDGAIEVGDADGTAVAVGVGEDHTVLIPPDVDRRGEMRVLEVRAERTSRVLHAVTGEGFGLRRG